MSLGFVLIIASHWDAAPQRNEEFLECLDKNIRCSHIDQIVAVLEDDISGPNFRSSLSSCQKISFKEHGKRASFRDLFSLSNACFSGRNIIIANSDIFFDNTLSLLANSSLTDKLLFLTRWEVLDFGPPRHLNWHFSQDAWIFRSPIKEFDCDWNLGVPGCEMRLAYEASMAGIAVSN